MTVTTRIGGALLARDATRAPQMSPDAIMARGYTQTHATRLGYRLGCIGVVWVAYAYPHSYAVQARTGALPAMLRMAAHVHPSSHRQSRLQAKVDAPLSVLCERSAHNPNDTPPVESCCTRPSILLDVHVAVDLVAACGNLLGRRQQPRPGELCRPRDGALVSEGG